MARPRSTVAPSSLGAMAISLVRKDPVFKWFADIEERMDTSEESSEQARDRAIEARIVMMRSKAAMMVATAVSSEVYATAVLRDASASPQTKKHAQAVIAWQGLMNAALTETNQAWEVEGVTKAVGKVALAKWSMLEVFSEMMASANGGTARPTAGALPTVVPLVPCPTGHPKIQPGRGTPRQRKILAYLASKGLEFVAHMYMTRPNDPFTRNLLMWNRSVEAYSVLAEVSTGSHAVTIGNRGSSRCIAVAFDSYSSIPRMLTRLLHELAHVGNSDPGAHSPVFYKIFREFLRVASEEMGWVLETTCRETCFGVAEKGYSPQTICPRCVWQKPPEQCKVTAGECEPSQVDREELKKMYANNPTMLSFLTTTT